MNNGHQRNSGVAAASANPLGLSTASAPAAVVPGEPQSPFNTTKAITTKPSAVATAGEQLDAFREIRTSLLAKAVEKGLSQFTTLVVETGPGAGAGFVARNLAAAFALQEGSMSILVDCDHRNPSQFEAFGFSADQPGLFDYLDQHQAALNMLSTQIPNLMLIPAGRARSSHREYFSSQLISDVLLALKRPRTFLVLEGPPTKGSPDARILSNQVDFVVLVTGYGTDTPETISKTVQLFDADKFAGVVFNDAE